MREFNSMTVAELKQHLRERKLPLSGKKSELISRLEENRDLSHIQDEEVGKRMIACPTCGAVLRYPHEYSGKLGCPKCSRRFDPANRRKSASSTIDNSNLTYGIVYCLLVIALFFFVWVVINFWPLALYLLHEL